MEITLVNRQKASEEVKLVGPLKREMYRLLGSGGVSFLKFSLGTIERLLPHISVSIEGWKVSRNGETSVSWVDNNRRMLNVSVGLFPESPKQSFCLSAQVQRRTGIGAGNIKRVIDDQEKLICQLIVQRITKIVKLKMDYSDGSDDSLNAIRAVFDEQVVCRYFRSRFHLEFDIFELISAIRGLSEQSYENKSLTLGCLVDSESIERKSSNPLFYKQFLERKKIRALSDGFRTAYRISSGGNIVKFEDLQSRKTDKKGTYYYPEWCEYLAGCCHGKVFGVCLTRQGDILILEAGSLRFSYRAGRWQYWNHQHIIDLLMNSVPVQHINRLQRTHLIRKVYRVALDVSFRRTGALFVLLKNKNDLRKIVLEGDAMNDPNREPNDLTLDQALPDEKIISFPRRILAEIAGLDGAVVISNSGKLLAYGSVLQPKKEGEFKPSEGSRTKAAIGASHYGLALKVSSDGDLSTYVKGEELLKI